MSYQLLKMIHIFVKTSKDYSEPSCGLSRLTRVALTDVMLHMDTFSQSGRTESATVALFDCKTAQTLSGLGF